MEKDIYEEIMKIKQSGDMAALATIVKVKGSTPREEGTKMLIKSDGTILGSVGGGCTEAEIWQEGMKAMKEGTSRLLHFDLTGREGSQEDLICGGTMDVFIEPIYSPPTLFLFGGGHIGEASAKIAKMVGFRVAVIDDRPAFANKERFPEADLILAEDFDTAFPKVNINKQSYIVIACRGHELDQKVLGWAMSTDARYVGMIGSKKKVKTVFQNLMESGVSEEKLKTVYAPIGLAIRAETPEEIAISIMAEVIKVRRAEEALPQPSQPVTC